MGRGSRRSTGTVGVCAQETARYTSFATSLARLDLPDGWAIHEVHGPYISYSRQALAENFDGDYLLFLDDDHTFAPNLIRQLLRRNVDIVAPFCVDRRRMLPVVDLDGRTGLVEVSNTGTAGMLVRRRVFDALEPPYFQSGFVADERGSVQHVPEDTYFCMKARAAGFATFVDTDTVQGHTAAATLTPVRRDDAWWVEITIGEQTLAAPLLDSTS